MWLLFGLACDLWVLKLLKRIFVFILIATLNSASINAQQSSTLSARAAAIKAIVDKLTTQTKITVTPLNGHEQFGKYLSSDQETFTFYDVDQKLDTTLRYEDVKKIKTGYGGYNYVTKRHTTHTHGIIAGVIVAGVLIALIVAAANLK